MARPILAERQVEVARRAGVTAVAHGCTGKGNDQVRFEHAYQALAPELKIVAPWREWKIRSREDALDYAARHNIPVAASRNNLHSRDRNLWHLSSEGGELEDPANAPLATTWQWTRSPQEAPDKPEEVEIEFEAGTPVGANGQRLEPGALVEALNEIGGRNARGGGGGGVVKGVKEGGARRAGGGVALVENRLVGIKSRGCYETPGGTLLVAAHRELEALCLDRELLHFKQPVALRYAELVYYGLWFTPLRQALPSFVNATQKMVGGRVRLEL